MTHVRILDDVYNLPVLLQQVRERINVLKMDTQRSSDYADRLEREALEMRNSAQKTKVWEAGSYEERPSNGSVTAHRHVSEPVHKETRASTLRKAHIAKMRAKKTGSSTKAHRLSGRKNLRISAHEYSSVHVDRHGNVSVKSRSGYVDSEDNRSANGAEISSANKTRTSNGDEDMRAFTHSAMYPRTIVERAKLTRIIQRVGLNRGIIEKQEKRSQQQRKDSRPRSRIDEYYIAQQMEGVRSVGQQGKEQEASNALLQAEKGRHKNRNKMSALKHMATAIERRQSQLIVSPERQAGLFKVYEAEVQARVSKSKKMRGFNHGDVRGAVGLTCL